MRWRPPPPAPRVGAAAPLTVVPVLVLGSKVEPVLQQHGADGGQVLLGGQMQRGLPVFGQLVNFGSGQQLRAETRVKAGGREEPGARGRSTLVPGCGQ